MGSIRLPVQNIGRGRSFLIPRSFKGKSCASVLAARNSKLDPIFMYCPAFPNTYMGDGIQFFSMKPIGALNPTRLKKFQEHYSSFKDPINPKCHYGSHYSSPGTVRIFRSCMFLFQHFAYVVCLMFGLRCTYEVIP